MKAKRNQRKCKKVTKNSDKISSIELMIKSKLYDIQKYKLKFEKKIYSKIRRKKNRIKRRRKFPLKKE